MAEQINKSRLDELLGIRDGQSFEDYMGSVTSPVEDADSVIDQTQKMLQETKDTVGEIEGRFQENLGVIDDVKNQIQKYGIGSLTPNRDENGSASQRIDSLVNVENAFKSIEDLVDTTKNMIANVYGIISSCDVLDSETVAATASLIGETRQLIAEYTSLFKQRIKFFDNVKMEMLKQQHRKELLDLKQKYDLDKIERKGSVPAQAQEVTGQNPNVPPGMVSMSTEDMLKMLQQLDNADTEEIVEESD